MPLPWLQKSEKSGRRATERRRERHGGSAGGPLAEDGVPKPAPRVSKKGRGGRKKEEARKKERLVEHESKEDLTRPWAQGPANLFNSCSKLMTIRHDASLLLQHTFLIHFLLNIDENPLWRLPPTPVHIPDSILMQN